MQARAGRFYRLRSGEKVILESKTELARYPFFGRFLENEQHGFGSWTEEGKWFDFDGGSHDYDLVEELVPYETWMCQVGTQSPMPAPDEEIAKRWAQSSQGRAFRVREILE